MANTKFLSILILTVLSCILVLILTCNKQQKTNPEIKVQDVDNAGMNHGSNYTPLGSLINSPWQYKEEYLEGVVNMGIYIKDKEIDSDSIFFTAIQKNLVFELQKDGSLKYWFKSGYLKSPNDTVRLKSGNFTYSHTVMSSEQLIVGKYLSNMYTNGKWSVNFNDSTILIDFGNNEFNLKPLVAKYLVLNASDMQLEETTYFDGIYEGKHERLKKITLSSFEH